MKTINVTPVSFSRVASTLSVTLLLSLAPLSLLALDITITPNDSIQVALDAVGNAGGGTVFMTSGNYSVPTSQKIPDNVTLKGSGATRPVITLSNGANVYVVGNKSIPFSNVKADYLSVNGGLTNAQMDAGTYNSTIGIDLSDRHNTVTNTNGTIINCYATNSSMGYVMGRTNNARLDSSSVTNCGGAPIGSTPGLHNIYISDCDPFIARYVTATYCRTGMGLKLTDFYGTRTETSQIVEYCQSNNNYDRGTAIYDLNPLIVRTNTCNNNGKSGINIFRCTSGGQLLNNTATGNLYQVNVSYDIWLNACSNMTITGNTYGTKNGF